MQQRCPKCGSPIAPGQRFCGGCGSQLSPSCPNCRITVSPGTRFCPSCGASLGGGSPQQPGGMPQQQPGWGQQPSGMPQQQSGWGQQPDWGQQPAWAPPAPSGQTSSRRLYLVILLIVLVIGLGGLVYWQFGDQMLGFFKSSTGGATTTTEKPEISDSQATAGETSAIIEWETKNEPSSTQVEYGTSKENTSLEPETPADDPTALDEEGQPITMGVVHHTVTLTDLDPDTTYYYRVKSKSKGGKEAVSEWEEFKTTTPEEAPEE